MSALRSKADGSAVRTEGLVRRFGGNIAVVFAVTGPIRLFPPFAFLTATFLSQEALTGWLATVTDYYPVTYLLADLRP